MSYQEHRSLWEVMQTDRSLSASFLVCLITKGLILNYYELKPELTESLLNLLTSKPLVTELEKSRTSSSVKNEMKRQSKRLWNLRLALAILTCSFFHFSSFSSSFLLLSSSLLSWLDGLACSVDLKIAIMNSIHYVILHYPIDFSHFSVKKAHTTWMDDLDKNKGVRELFENEVNFLSLFFFSLFFFLLLFFLSFFLLWPCRPFSFIHCLCPPSLPVLSLQVVQSAVKQWQSWWGAECEGSGVSLR